MNRFVFHVFTHNPWTDRRPGMTLNGVGSFFQRDQTWWRPGRVWFDYAARCQAVLQEGRPVADVAVFTGEEVPRRAVIPEQLISTLPGIIGADIVAREEARLANVGQPLREMPVGVFAGANISKPADWVDPLHGYAYDSINADALLRLVSVRDGRIVLPGGASYAVLVLPAERPLSPYPEAMTPEIAARVRDLVEAGATVVMCERPVRSPSLTNYPACDEEVGRIGADLWPGSGTKRLGRGRVVAGPWGDASFSSIGIEPDCVATELGADRDPADVRRIAWTHREDGGADIYFISNQDNAPRDVELSLRAAGRVPEIWDPVTCDMRTAGTWRIESGRTILPLRLPPCGSAFVVLRAPTGGLQGAGGPNWADPAGSLTVAGPWTVAFDPAFGGPQKPVVLPELASWSSQEDPAVRYYSGTARYAATFTWSRPAGKPGRVWLDVGRVANLAEVTVNGVDCGVAWTPPYRVDVTAALRPGANDLAIDVTNTWANRLIGDHGLPPGKRTSFMQAPYRLDGRPLLEAGLLGPVSLLSE
jgi:alpha-L-rhamnosidase